MGKSPTTRSMSPNLDLLRSLAVLMVLFDHICRHFHHDRIGGIAVVDIGFFGVFLFFVHTSLVLMSSMERSHLRGTALMRNFYIRRFFRIFPLSILVVLAAVALHLHADGRGLSYGARPGPGELISNLLLTQNLTHSHSIVGPLWTLPLEVQMYVLLPFLFLWKKRSLTKLLVLWAACAVLGHFPQTIYALSWFTLLLYIPNFLPGILAFSLPENRFIPSFLWPPFILLLLTVFVLNPGRQMAAELCLLLGLAIPLFKEISLPAMKFVSHEVAKYSYGIYLGHSFCVWLALTRFHSWVLLALTLVAVPVALYYTVERPGIRLGVRLADWASRPRRQAVPAVA